MSAFLIVTSVVTTVLIPADKFREGGEANGRALAGFKSPLLSVNIIFGFLYEISTILILSFARASAMAGWLYLIPPYSPRIGTVFWIGMPAHASACARLSWRLLLASRSSSELT